MRKALLYFIIAIVVIGIVGAVLYFLMRGNNQSSDQGGQTGSLPSASGSGAAFNQGGLSAGDSDINNGSSSTVAENLIIAANGPVLDYFANSDNSITAIGPDGTISMIQNGNVDILNSSKIKDIINIGFSYDGSKIMINFGDLQDSQTSVFDLKTRTWTPLPAGMLSPQWSPVDYRIIYLKNNSNGTETLTTFDTSKTKNNAATVTTLHLQDVSLLWRTKNEVFFYDNPSVYTMGSLWSFDLQKKSIHPVITEQRGAESIWNTATTSTGMLFTGDASQYGGALRLIDESGNTIQQLGFLTMPSKCLFDQYIQATTPASASTTIATSSYLALYCGIPRNQNTLSSSRLPDDYEQKALFTSDNIYRINTINGSVDALFNDQKQSMDVLRIKVFNNNLFFINRYDQKLYSIRL